MGKLINFELVLALHSFLTGVKIAVAYDVLKIFRCIVKHGKILVGIEDFIFANICGIVVFSMLYTYNDGSLRSFAMFLIFLGMLLYGKTVSKVVIKSINTIVKTIRKTLQKLKKKDKMKEQR